MKVTSYLHHGNYVFVREDLKGKHREHCLCFKCDHFSKNDKENCRRANLLFAFDKAFSMVTPVWECPVFENIEGR